MILRLYPVMPALQPYVKVICTMEGSSSDNSSIRVLPDTCVELFINYSSASLAKVTGKKVFSPSRNFIVSRMNNFMDVEMPGNTAFISVCFYTETACMFFPLPMNEVANTLTNLHDLWGQEATDMEEQVNTVPHNDQKVAIVQQYLLKQLQKNRAEDIVVNYCLQKIRRVKSVSELANKVGMSQRQLSRRFNNRLGLSTKEFMAVNRFVYSLTHLKQYPAMSLTDIAYASGYYDQAHFIHDYHTFAGLSPKAILTTPNLIYCE
ncbi:helix-turn-helix domain-containing protein [Emticicia sp. 17c]|uniref:helix-turn-helix domain-containing protein n=1 Tax=Emticicia sp. 17c TaxID=3127704 RepID=UPI00301BA1DB